MPNFNTGAEALEAKAQAAQGKSRKGFKERHLNQIEALKKSGGSVTVRFLTELTEIIGVMQHTAATTKRDMPGYEKLPKKMTAVCRNDEQFPEYDSCYLCDNPPKSTFQGREGQPEKPALRGWALACLREEVKDDAGNIVGYRDEVVEVEGPDGQKTMVKNIVIVNYAENNFFTPLSITARETAEPGQKPSLTNRDIKIIRQGEGTGTSYIFMPKPVTPDHQRGTESWAAYDKSIEEQGLELQELVFSKTTDDFYNRLFDRTKDTRPKDKDGETSAAPASNGAAPAAQVPVEEAPDAAMLEELKARAAGR